MSQTPLTQLNELSQAFAKRQGEVALIAQSKRDPALVVKINPDLLLPSASVIKAAIACTAADLAASGKLDLSRTIAVSEIDETFYCSILHAFDGTDRVTIKNLIGLMLIVSDNPATMAVLRCIGMDSVGAWLAHHGAIQTTLTVPFDDASLGTPLRANLTTAEECLKLFQLIDREPNYEFVKRMLANNLRNERIPKRLPDDAVIAHKTGTLSGLVHDAAIIESPCADYYLIVLSDALEDEAAFVRDLADYSEAVYALMSE
ncbi:MAG: serine hydrolase [Pseudomonadota bacterium]